jgi:hypothetical protein
MADPGVATQPTEERHHMAAEEGLPLPIRGAANAGQEYDHQE